MYIYKNQGKVWMEKKYITRVSIFYMLLLTSKGHFLASFSAFSLEFSKTDRRTKVQLRAYLLVTDNDFDICRVSWQQCLNKVGKRKSKNEFFADGRKCPAKRSFRHLNLCTCGLRNGASHHASVCQMLQHSREVFNNSIYEGAYLEVVK